MHRNLSIDARRARSCSSATESRLSIALKSASRASHGDPVAISYRLQPGASHALDGGILWMSDAEGSCSGSLLDDLDTSRNAAVLHALSGIEQDPTMIAFIAVQASDMAHRQKLLPSSIEVLFLRRSVLCCHAPSWRRLADARSLDRHPAAPGADIVRAFVQDDLSPGLQTIALHEAGLFLACLDGKSPSAGNFEAPPPAFEISLPAVG